MEARSDRVLVALETLEHIEAIKTLEYRYFRACDAKDREAFRGCFIARGADTARRRHRHRRHH